MVRAGPAGGGAEPPGGAVGGDQPALGGPGGLLLAALAPAALTDYPVHVLTVAWYYVILASSWNLIAGYAGLFSLAHHVFAGIGGYASALMVIRTGVPVPVGIACGGVLAGAAGYVIGALTLRMRALFLALAAWAFAEAPRGLVLMESGISPGHR